MWCVAYLVYILPVHLDVCAHTLQSCLICWHCHLCNNILRSDSWQKKVTLGAERKTITNTSTSTLRLSGWSYADPVECELSIKFFLDHLFLLFANSGSRHQNREAALYPSYPALHAACHPCRSKCAPCLSLQSLWSFCLPCKNCPSHLKV